MHKNHPWKSNTALLSGSIGHLGLPRTGVFSGLPDGWEIFAFEHFSNLILVKFLANNHIDLVAESALDEFVSAPSDLRRYLIRGGTTLDWEVFSRGDPLHDGVVRSACDFIRQRQ